MQAILAKGCNSDLLNVHGGSWDLKLRVIELITLLVTQATHTKPDKEIVSVYCSNLMY